MRRNSFVNEDKSASSILLETAVESFMKAITGGGCGAGRSFVVCPYLDGAGRDKEVTMFTTRRMDTYKPQITAAAKGFNHWWRGVLKKVT